MKTVSVLISTFHDILYGIKYVVFFVKETYLAIRLFNILCPIVVVWILIKRMIEGLC